MKRIAFLLLGVIYFCCFSCRQESILKPLPGENEEVKTQGTWKKVATLFPYQIEALTTYNNKIIVANPKVIAPYKVVYSHELNNNKFVTHKHLPSGGSGFNRFKIINNELYAFGSILNHGGCLKFNSNDNSWSVAYGCCAVRIHDADYYNGDMFYAYDKSPYLKSYNNDIETSFNNKIRFLLNYNGKLIAAGDFTQIGDQSFNKIAQWNGTKWEALGGGINGTIRGVTIHKGNLVIVGTITKAGTTPCNNIAIWNGAEWNLANNGLQAQYNSNVNVLKSIGNQLIVAGYFTKAGDKNINNLAMWDGNEWHSISPFNYNYGVINHITYLNNRLHISSGGNLYKLE